MRFLPRLLACVALVLVPSLALAQGAVPLAPVPNRPANDNGPAPANTRYVDSAVQVLLNALAGKAPLANPVFSGTVTAPSLTVPGAVAAGVFTGNGSPVTVTLPGATASRSLDALAAAIAGNISNIAALRALPIGPLAPWVAAAVSGYIAPSDLGGGTFVWAPDATSADDGCVTIRPTAIATGSPGRWIRTANELTPEMCGAYGDGQHDDTAPVQSVVATGRPLYLPQQYKVSKTIFAQTTRIRGRGKYVSGLIGSTALPVLDPVLRLGAGVHVSSLFAKYENGAITGSETEGQRVAIDSIKTDERPGWFPLQRATIDNVYLANIGTGMRAAPGAPVFSSVFQTIEIEKFSYRAWDFRSFERTGNVYQNIYIVNGLPNADRGFALDGEESEASIDQLNVEHSILNYAVSLKNIKGLSAGTIHLEGGQQRNANTGFMRVDDVTGSVAALAAYNTRFNLTGGSVLEIGNSTAGPLVGSLGSNRLRVGAFYVQGLNDPNIPLYPDYGSARGLENVASFALINRTAAAAGSYTLAVDSYRWASYRNGSDSAIYASPPISGAGITYERFGAALAVGTTPYQLQPADGTAAGGNARGQYALDLQRSRAAPSMVASGYASVILGGANNTAAGDNSLANGVYAYAGGAYSTALGLGVQAFADYSNATGRDATDRGRIGNRVYASGAFSGAGGAQASDAVLRAATAGASAARLTADGAAPTAANSYSIPDATAATCRIAVTATGPGATYSWVASHALLTRGSGAGTTALAIAGSPTVLSTGAVTGAAVSVAADTTNGSLSLSFTPPSGNSATWHAVGRVDCGEAQ